MAHPADRDAATIRSPAGRTGRGGRFEAASAVNSSLLQCPESSKTAIMFQLSSALVDNFIAAE
jgi:hypothetical protein